MKTTLAIQYPFTISHSFMPGRRLPAPIRPRATTRRTSPVLSAQELRQIVGQMID
jgi:hypothetical protein